MHILSIRELTAYIRALLEEDFRLQDVWLTGELSNPSRPASGHFYFTLKDDGAQLKGLMWRSQVAYLGRLPQHGEAVVVHGRIGVYEANGIYQLYADAIESAGVGALHAQFEALKDRLRDEGLFERQRPLPTFPRHIGVVTSPGAAAWRDVLAALERRWPLARVTLAPTLVQGVDAPSQIALALRALNQFSDADVILLVRGGGSLEDLWAFNDEIVARAIWESQIPVVCGVGHETDVTIADFVADLRAPTPTAAAELATPNGRELQRQVEEAAQELEAVFQGLLADKSSALHRLERRLDLLSPQRRIEDSRRRIAELHRRGRQSLTHQVALAQAQLAGQTARLATLDPYATLRRGYAIVTEADTGRVVQSARQARTGQALRVHVADGSFETTVGRQKRLFDP